MDYIELKGNVLVMFVYVCIIENEMHSTSKNQGPPNIFYAVLSSRGRCNQAFFLSYKRRGSSIVCTSNLEISSHLTIRLWQPLVVFL